MSRRYTLLLNGMAVELPAKKLPAAAKLSFAHKLYPSLRYTLALNRGPGVIGAGALAAAGGGSGEGIKIGVVDDGVDPKSTFFDPAGFTYPEGFPKGGTKWTTPKVIVARSFVGVGADDASRLALDVKSSFHGTHVAGIAAGIAGTTAPASRDHPEVTGLSGVAPRAQIGNYRVFNVPTFAGHVGNTPEIVAAFESAVRDGMDVINFSGGGPQTDPASDALIEAVRNVAAAGVVPVISAGNDRDDYGLGSTGSPGTAPDAISVAALSNTHVFAPALTVVGAGAPESMKRIPFAGRGAAAWATSDQPLVDVGSIVSVAGTPTPRNLCGPPGNLNGGASPLPAGSLTGTIALVSRGDCVFVLKAARAKAAGAIGIVLVDNRPGEANGIPVELAVPSGMISDLDGAQLRAYLAAHGGRAPIRIGSDTEELATGRSGVVTSFSSGGLTAFGHQLKPDVGAPGGAILSSTLPIAGGPFAVFDGTSMAAPHVAGAAALLLQRHPGWTPRQVKSALVSTAGAAWVDTARTVEAPVILSGGGLADVVAANEPKLFTEPVSLSFGDLNVNRGGTSRSLLLSLADAGGGAGAWSIELKPQAQPAGVAIEVAGSAAIAPGGQLLVPVTARATGDAGIGEAYGFLLLRRGADVRKVPYALLVTRPGLESAPVQQLQFVQIGDTRTGRSRASVYKYPAAAFGPAASYTGPRRERGRRRGAVPDPRRRARREPRSGRDLVVAGLADPSVGARLAGRERRPGLRRHAREREQPDDRLSARHRRRRNRLPAHQELLRLGGLGARSLHGPLARRTLCASRLGERRRAAAARADHVAGLGGATDDRAARARRGGGCRSVFARDLLRTNLDRSGGLRPELRNRALPAARTGAGAEGGQADADGRGRRLPGGQERRFRR